MGRIQNAEKNKKGVHQGLTGFRTLHIPCNSHFALGRGKQSYAVTTAAVVLPALLEKHLHCGEHLVAQLCREMIAMALFSSRLYKEHISLKMFCSINPSSPSASALFFLATTCCGME